ncbi:ATP synthase subunit I [Fictibacillus phosphorivorans]|uniref:ATP synthase subunit I n=1 Tax=Fictibacillus phosphorivorans TaxID=1221500 RepID=UPI003CEBDAD2
MNEFNHLIKRYLIFSYCLLTVLILSFIMGIHKLIFASLALGLAFSSINLLSMYSEIRRLNNVASQNKKFRSFSTFSRLSVAAMAILIALKFPDNFHLLSVVIGLLLIYIIIFIDFVVKSITRYEKR